MMYRVDFTENNKSFHTFIDAANEADAAETVVKTFEALNREIEIAHTLFSQQFLQHQLQND